MGGSRHIVRYSVALAVLLALWAILGESGVLRTAHVPGPRAVFESAGSLSPSLWSQALSTAVLIVVGFLFGLVTAWVLAGASLLSSRIEATVAPVADLLRGLPPVCLIPFFILWFGFLPQGKILLIALNVALVIYPALISHFRDLDPKYREAWASLGRTSQAFVLSEGLRATAAPMLSTYRFGLSFAVILAIVAEAMGATDGLGHIISVAGNTLALSNMVAASLAAAVLAALIDLAFVLAYRFVFPWTVR